MPGVDGPSEIRQKCGHGNYWCQKCAEEISGDYKEKIVELEKDLRHQKSFNRVLSLVQRQRIAEEIYQKALTYIKAMPSKYSTDESVEYAELWQALKKWEAAKEEDGKTS